MAISKKGKRQITVGDERYFWLYKFQTENLRVVIFAEEEKQSRLICNFTYYDSWLSPERFADGKRYNDRLLDVTNGILTSWTVRQIIDFAKQSGWKPFEKNGDFIIENIGDKIDLDSLTKPSNINPKSKIENPKFYA